MKALERALEKIEQGKKAMAQVYLGYSYLDRFIHLRRMLLWVSRRRRGFFRLYGRGVERGLDRRRGYGRWCAEVFFKFGESVIAYADEALKAADGGALAGKYASDFLVDGSAAGRWCDRAGSRPTRR